MRAHAAGDYFIHVMVYKRLFDIARVVNDAFSPSLWRSVPFSFQLYSVSISLDQDEDDPERAECCKYMYFIHVYTCPCTCMCDVYFSVLYAHV